MKIKCLSIIILIHVVITVSAQQPVLHPNAKTFNKAYLQSHTHYFTIDDNNKLQGEGAEVLISVVQAAQYTLLGEYHGSSQLGKFTKAILPVLKAADYEKFGLEVGPTSAKKLQQLSSIPAQTTQSLYDFNTKHRVGPLDDLDTPIPFFNAVEDAAFLQTAAELGFDLWGFDQEYYSSPLMLADELLLLEKSNANYEQINLDKLAFDSLFIAAYLIDSAGEEETFEMFKVLTEHEKTKKFFAHFDNNEAAQFIINDLYKTWDIYNRYGKRGGLSHEIRVNLIRENFTRYYQAEYPKQSKVFIKIGGFHGARGYGGDVFDVGNLVADLAEAHNQQSVHINCIPRYYQREKGLYDQYEARPNHFYRPFYEMGKKDQWALIDLRPIRKDLLTFNIQMMNTPQFTSIKNIAEQMDFILIPPVDQDSQANYEEMPRIK